MNTLKRFCHLLLAMAFTALILLPPSANAYNLTEEEKTNISIYRNSSPAVVNITSTAMSLDMFLNPIPQQGMGSGVILTKEGYILTNGHVVDNADYLEVTLLNGTSFQAKLIGKDMSKDIALIKIEPGEYVLPTIALGKSDDLQVGQVVYAIGNPFGLKSTLTKGLISSLGRTIKARNGRLIEDIIQTDAAINPGNSGGPLLNSEGKMIGINTAIFSPNGASAGIGFTIPINTVKRIANDLIEHGRVLRPYIGIRSSLNISPKVAQALHLAVDNGVLIETIQRQSPAHVAGLRPGNQMVRIGNRQFLLGGDIIIEMDGQPVTDALHFMNDIESKSIGDTIVVKLVRDGKIMSVPVVLEEKPSFPDKVRIE